MKINEQIISLDKEIVKKNNVKVLRLEASEIFKINNGINIKMEYKTVLPYSLLKAKLDRLHIDFKDNKSRDIIGVNFNYGYDTDRLREIEEEIKINKNKLKEYKKETTIKKNEIKKDKTINDKEERIKKLIDDRNETLTNYINKIKELENECKIEKKNYDKDALREKLYQDGFTLTHTYKRKGQEVKDIIKYKFWFRTPAKSRVGDSIFINEKIYDDIVKWQDMGLILPSGESKVVEFQAYRSLTASHIERTIEINPKNILVVNDLDSFKEIDIISIEMQKYKTTDIIKAKLEIKKDKITGNKERSIIKFKEKYKTLNFKEICVAIERKDKVKNTLWDGMSILDEEYYSEGHNFYLLRHHMFKSCSFKGKVVRYLKDWCEANGYNYETHQVKDRYGNKIRVKNIRMICTENSCKFEKFAECGVIGKDGKEITSKKQMFGYWKQRVKDDKYLFGICKHNHSSKYGNFQRMSYQMGNTLLIDKDRTKKLAKYTIDYVNNLKQSDEVFLKMLKDTATEGNNNNLILDLYSQNKDFKECDFYKTFKTKTISNIKKRAKQGKLLVEGDNLTVCGNPYLLLLHAVGEVPNENNIIEEGFIDPTLPVLDDYISCYTERFNDDVDIAGFRNPHNAPNNIGLFKNYKHDLIKKYFDFGQNIIAINMVNTEIQDLMNSMDEDSDFILVTINSIVTEATKDVFRKKDYACIVNNIPKDNKKWINNNESIAKIDNLLAKSKNDIGITSNLAQIALSYFQHNKSKELRDIVCICSVLAQVAIDNAKRQYKVNIAEEIERIKNLDCMKEHDLPSWMQVIKKDVKSNKFEDINCTMKYLQQVIDENVIDLTNNIPNLKIEDLLTDDIKLNNKTNYEQTEKIEELIKKFDNQVKYVNKLAEKYKWKKEKTEKEVAPIRDTLINRVASMKITKESMYSLVEKAIEKRENEKNDINETESIGNINDTSKYKSKMLNVLYNTHKKLFLQMFKVHKENAIV